MISLSLFNDIESQNLANEFKLIPSFSKGPSFKNGALQDLPWKEVVQNTYTRAFSTGYWNSIIITFLNVLVSVVLKVIVTMLMGYAFSLKNWRGKNVIWFFALALLVLPEIALLSGQLQVVFRLKLNATYFGFVLTIALPFVASVFNAIMYKTAFEAIPDRIKEVALVDGAVGHKYFFKNCRSYGFTYHINRGNTNSSSGVKCLPMTFANFNWKHKRFPSSISLII